MRKITQNCLKYMLVLVTGITFFHAKAQLSFSDPTNLNQLFLNECGLPDTMTVKLTAASSQSNVTVTPTIPAFLQFVKWISQAGTSISGTTISIASIAAGANVQVKYLLKSLCGANSSATSYIVNYTIGGYSGGIIPSANPPSQDFISSV